MPKRRFSDELRRAVEGAELSRYAISKATGIDQAVLSKFVHGHVGLSFESLDKLADLLGWSLAKPQTKKPKAKPKAAKPSKRSRNG